MAFIHYTASYATQPSPLDIVGADSIMGSTVVDRHNQRIGELRDIMLDLSTGRIAYAVIGPGPRGAERPLIVVPWNAMLPDHGGQRLRINAHADWIARAPTVQPGYAPDHFVKEWGALIHNYFGTRPYWTATSSPQYC